MRDGFVWKERLTRDVSLHDCVQCGLPPLLHRPVQILHAILDPAGNG